MNERSGLFFSALVKCSLSSNVKDFFPFLPEEWHDRCALKPLYEGARPEHFLVGYDAVKRVVHPSWESELLSFLPQASSLDSSPKRLSHFLLDYAVHVSPFCDMPDPSECRDSPLFFLLQIDKKELQNALELLSVFSLVGPFLKIVDKKRMARCFLFLSAVQKKWLSFLLLHPKRFAVEQIDLEDMIHHSTPEQGKQALFEKGMLFFAQALAEESETLVRLVCYRLEMAVGKKIFALVQTMKKDPKTSQKMHALLKFIFNNAQRRGL